MRKTPEKVAVTGGAGFIGSHISHRLADMGFHVIIIDNLLRGKKAYITDLLDEGKATFIDADVQYLFKEFEDVSYVFHEAAVCINYSMKWPSTCFDVNIEGTRNVLQSALESKVKKVIFASSASVYGNPVYLPMKEDHPLNPITPYCVSKITGENLLKMYEQKGLKYVALRNFNVYGPRQSVDAYYTSVILSFIQKLNRNESPIIYGSGVQSMDFINVHDVVEANILAMTSDVSGKIFNVGSGEQTSINELAHTLIKLMKKDLAPIYEHDRTQIVQKRQADITNIKRELGFEPKTPLKKGLKEVIADIINNPSYY